MLYRCLSPAEFRKREALARQGARARPGEPMRAPDDQFGEFVRQSLHTAVEPVWIAADGLDRIWARLAARQLAHAFDPGRHAGACGDQRPADTPDPSARHRMLRVCQLLPGNRGGAGLGPMLAQPTRIRRQPSRSITVPEGHLPPDAPLPVWDAVSDTGQHGHP